MASKDIKTIEAYLAALPPDAAHIMEQVRELMREIAPDVRESIKYSVPQFEYSGTYLYIAAWKTYLGLYPIHPAADPALEADIAPHRAKKDSVHFHYKHPIPFDLIARIARARIGDS